MLEMETIAQFVEFALLTNPETRNSDSVLYAEICKKINPLSCEMDMVTLLSHRALYGLPNFESVGRTRRKLQHDNPKLRASKSVEDKRYENWKEVRKWAIE